MDFAPSENKLGSPGSFVAGRKAMTAGDPGECTHVYMFERMLSSLRCLLATILSNDRLILAQSTIVSDSSRDQNSASEESARTLLSPAQRMLLVLAPLVVIEIDCSIFAPTSHQIDQLFVEYLG